MKLINKFIISRTDNKKIDDDAIFFVLRLDFHDKEKDHETKIARLAFSKYCEFLDDKELHNSMFKKLNELDKNYYGNSNK